MADRRVGSGSLKPFSLRPVLFWGHLVAALAAGTLILVMSVTGVLLTYERQLIAWADRGYRSVPSVDARRLPVSRLVAGVQAQYSDFAPETITISAADDAPVTLGAAGRTLYVDAYSGDVLGESKGTVRRLMSDVRAWHRWLAVEGDGRAIARFATGWATVIFLFILVSGLYLWFPRKWTRQHIRPTVWFTGSLRGRARDFNWHNTIGAWSVVPLLIIVLSALPMSFPWANAALYRAVGETAPARGGGDRAAGGVSRSIVRDRAESDADSAVIDAAWDRARAQQPGWTTITLRLPASRRPPFSFAIDRGTGGQPQLRSTLTVYGTGHVISYQTFDDQTPGARLRSISRFAHTGEVLGVPGQTIAGFATAGASVLVCTGFALAFRRLVASTRHRSGRGVIHTRETTAA